MGEKWCRTGIDWLIMLGTGPHSPDAPRPYKQALCATYQNQRSPVALLKLQMAPKLILLMSCGSKKKEPRYLCLSEAKASHSQRMWAEVSSLTPHFLHSGRAEQGTMLLYENILSLQ